MSSRTLFVPACVLGILVATSCTRETGKSTSKSDSATEVPLFDNLGSMHRKIVTKSDRAQKYFDQGLRLTYGFNHEEAVKSFRAAQKADPDCAMCYWGEALALGPNINLPMDSSAAAPAYNAVQEAVRRADPQTAADRALIQALAKRYAQTNEKRSTMDSAYATAMRDVVAKYPDDPDVVTLYADAVMDLTPWDYWLPGDKPRPEFGAMLPQLEQTVAKFPDHPGVCHFFIHAVEKPMPEKAVACAEKLPSLMPGAGHLVHMPAHIYMRVGRYDDAIKANQHATHADAKYVQDRKPQGVYMIGYVPHNFHFLWAAASMAGQKAVAQKAASEVAERVKPEMVRQVPFIEGLLPTKYLAYARFGDWDAILKEPPPDTGFQYTTAVWHYTRGLAYAGKGDFAKATSESEQLRATAKLVPKDFIVGINTAGAVLQVAQHMLTGEIALRQKEYSRAIGELQQGVKLEDALLYDEPPAWYQPVRQSLGLALLEAGRAKEAEAVYREDLRRNPNNGWSLYGLSQALTVQRRTADASGAEEAFKKAWANADVKLTSSRF
jgi:tetratricopeptide (TPR) repeat protein